MSILYFVTICMQQRSIKLCDYKNIRTKIESGTIFIIFLTLTLSPAIINNGRIIVMVKDRWDDYEIKVLVIVYYDYS